MKYNIIYADPPWSYDDKALNRGGAERHYSTMKLDDICALPVANITAKDCLLFIWGGMATNIRIRKSNKSLGI